MSKPRIEDIKQGDVFMVNLKDGIANEENGTRPCVCISCNSLTKNRNNVIIAPITSSANKKSMINHYEIPIGKYDFFIYEKNTVLLECLRDITKKRLERRLGHLESDDIDNIIKKLTYNFIDNNKEDI